MLQFTKLIKTIGYEKYVPEEKIKIREWLSCPLFR